MRVLILDSTALVADFRLRGHDFTALLRNLGVVADLVGLPSVVVEETSNKYTAAVEASSRTFDQARKEFARLTGCTLALLEHQKAVAELPSYRAVLETRIGDALRVLEHPTISHSEVVERAIKRRKPFRDGDAGYRDTLIWETVLEVLSWKDQPSVLFVTNNKRDFYVQEEIAPDLLEDLDSRGIERDRLTQVDTVKSLVAEKVLPHLNKLHELSRQIASAQVAGVNFNSWLEDALFDSLDARDVARVLIDLKPGEGTVELSEVYEIASVEVDESFLLSDSEHYVVITVEAGVGINVCADWYQYEGSVAITQLFDEDGVGQPAPYACVYTGDRIRVRLSLLIESYEPFNGSLEVLGTFPIDNDA